MTTSTTSVTTSTGSGAYTETSGNTLLVLNGGTVSAATISSGGFLTVSSGGKDFAGVISAAGTETVSNGGSATGDQIYGGATVTSGGFVSNETVQSGGLLTVNSGGIDSSTTISAGANETVLGSASGDRIYGTQLVSNGTAIVTNETVFNGGNLNLFLKGAIATGTIVSSGGALNINGNAFASNTVLSGGGILELQSPKADLTGTLTFAGGGNTLDIVSVASAGSFGDQAVISGFSSTDKIDVSVFGAGATASYSSSGGNEVVTIGSTSGTEKFLFSGTSVYTSNTLALVTSGAFIDLEYSSIGFGSTTSVTTSTASGAYTETAPNTLLVLSGGSVSAATIASGAFLVVNGGTDYAAIVSAGAIETVSSGFASGDQIYGSLTTLSGGAGSLTNETVHNGGSMTLANGNPATGTIVLGGGTLTVSGSVAATDTTLNSGGTLVLNSPKATLSGGLVFSGGGNTLDIASVASAGSYGEQAVISGFSATDKIDVSALGAGATASYTTSGGNEVVTINGISGSEQLLFSGTSIYTSNTLSLVTSGAVIDLEYSATGFGSTTSVTTSTASGAYTEKFGDTLLVLGGGSVSAATIGSNADLIVNGGIDYAANVAAGAIETVSTGSATQDHIYGGATVDAGAIVSGETVQSGGTLLVNSGAVDSASIVAAGGSATVLGSATGDQIYGGATVIAGGSVTNETVQGGGLLTVNSGGVDSSTTILAGANETVLGSASGDQIYGTQLVSNGTAVVTNETVFNGGNLNVFLKGGIASGTVVSSGGALNINGAAFASNTILSGGGILELQSPKADVTGSLTFAGGGNILEITGTTSAGYGDLAVNSGFSSSDKIAITSAAFAGSALTLQQGVSNGNTVAQVVSGGTTVVETFTFAGTALAGNLGLVSDGAGGVDLEISSASSPVTTSVTTSTASGSFTETAPNTLLVLSGGSVSAPTIDGGAFLVVNGGADFAATVSSGGVETLSSGTATGDQIFGSAIVRGGAVFSETVQSGGELTVSGGSANNTLLNGGAVLDLASPSATLSGSLTFANGGNTLEAGAISSSGDGDQAAISGFSSSDRIDATGISPTGATLSFTTNGAGDEVITINGTGGSEAFLFSDPTAYNASTMSFIADGHGGVDLILDTTPVVAFTSLGGESNQAVQTVNGTVDTTLDPEAIGSTVSVSEGNSVIGTATVGANGHWSAKVTFQNDAGANVLTASDTDTAGNTGVTSQSLTYNVNTAAPAFSAGNLVISISGDGDGSGSYGDNQASPITLEQITKTGAYVSQLVLPQTTTVVNGVTEYAISGEYGSSSEGSLELSADGHSLVIAGYGINDQTYNTGGAAVYGNAALAQTTSAQGGQYTAVPRVIADINANGVIDTSTALYNVFNTNNPRSVATVDGSSFYIAGQGVKGDTTQGVFYVTDGSSTATIVNDATDMRTVEIYDGQLYVSTDSKQGPAGGTTNISVYGAALPTSATSPTVLQGISNPLVLTAAQANTVNSSDIGSTVNLSPESFFFANADTLYVADGGAPKEGGLGDGGLQKWVYDGTRWTLEYTLSEGLNLIPNTDTSSSGDTGLIGLTGEVVGNSVELFATTEPLNDLGQTAVVEITDSLSSTTGSGETFATLLKAGAGENIRGISLAPTAVACYCRGTAILAENGEVAVETLSIGDILVTKSGELRPIKWIGKRSYTGRFAIGQKHILPIRIKAGALDDNVPRRDLWISPHHAMYLDGVLIESQELVNGVSIVQAEQIDVVEYFHIELESHDVIVAEGALSESFIDDDSRAMFHNAGEYAELYPQQVAGSAHYCAPRLYDGYLVEAVRARIESRAGLRPVACGASALRGYVDAVSADRIAGWAQNVDHPEAPVCLDILAGDEIIGQVLANRYRADLDSAGLGSGRHSFEFVPPQGLAFTAGSIEVRRSLDGAKLESAMTELSTGRAKMLARG